MTKKVLLAIALIVVSIVLTGCQTVAGFGGDIKWTAESTADVLEGE